MNLKQISNSSSACETTEATFLHITHLQFHKSPHLLQRYICLNAATVQEVEKSKQLKDVNYSLRLFTPLPAPDLFLASTSPRGEV